MTAGPRIRLDGADVDPATGALLSIAQLQAALRTSVVADPCTPVPPSVSVAGDSAPVRPIPRTGAAASPATRPSGQLQWPPVDAEVGTVLPPWLAGVRPDLDVACLATAGHARVGDAAVGFPGVAPVVGVVAVHPGAGGSTIAAALADAAAAGLTEGPPRWVHLVEWAHAGASGLTAASVAELGAGPCGRWRHGRRGRVCVSRPVGPLPATAPDPGRWTGEHPADVTVFDLGALPAATTAQLPAGVPLVLVCRATLPSLRRLETLLTGLTCPPPRGAVTNVIGETGATADPAVAAVPDAAERGRVVGADAVAAVAVVGPVRWPGPVQACVGPGLRALIQTDRVVRVPAHRQLAVTGLTSAPLPRPVAAAGARLRQLTQTLAHAPRPGSARAGTRSSRSTSRSSPGAVLDDLFDPFRGQQ